MQFTVTAVSSIGSPRTTGWGDMSLQVKIQQRAPPVKQFCIVSTLTPLVWGLGGLCSASTSRSLLHINKLLEAKGNQSTYHPCLTPSTPSIKYTTVLLFPVSKRSAKHTIGHLECTNIGTLLLILVHSFGLVNLCSVSAPNHALH